jgi:hypothetical protein
VLASSTGDGETPLADAPLFIRKQGGSENRNFAEAHSAKQSAHARAPQQPVPG